MTLFDAVLKRSRVIAEWFPKYRQGQRLFRALSDIDKALAESIAGTDLDPFYDDSHCLAFYSWLTEQGNPPEPTEKHKVRQGDIKG
jgi:hypothetical protein